MGNIIPTKGSVASSPGRQRLQDFVSWFEIPVFDIHRASTFYNTIYQMEMEMNVNGDFAMAFFPADRGIGGALVLGPGCTPSATGPLIYLNAGRDMDSVLARVEQAGGRVIMGRSMISESAGAFALFIDSEGNRLALHEAPSGVTAATAAGTSTPGKRTSTERSPARSASVGKAASGTKAAGKKAAGKKAAGKQRARATSGKKSR